MTRVPISFYLNILAGSLVLFHHCASSETGDVALNKVTGATGRFYALFEGMIKTFHGGCMSQLEAALCSPAGQLAIDNLLSTESVDFIKTRYCYQATGTTAYHESVVGNPRSQSRRGGYGGSDFVYEPLAHAPKTVPLAPYSPAMEDPAGGTGRPSQPPFAFWKQGLGALEIARSIGTIALSASAAVFCYRDPVKILGVLFAAHSVLQVLAYRFPDTLALRYVIQIFTVATADLSQCARWECCRHLLDFATLAGELTYICITQTRNRLQQRWGRS